jgi:hypothetical protein
VGDKGYYLQTNDYKRSSLTYDPATDKVTGETIGSGMKIDLDSGKIDAYNYEFKGEDSSSHSFIKITSQPNNYLQMHYRVIEDGTVKQDNDVFRVGLDNYFF